MQHNWVAVHGEVAYAERQINKISYKCSGDFYFPHKIMQLCESSVTTLNPTWPQPPLSTMEQTINILQPPFKPTGGWVPHAGSQASPRPFPRRHVLLMVFPHRHLDMKVGFRNIPRKVSSSFWSMHVPVQTKLNYRKNQLVIHHQTVSLWVLETGNKPACLCMCVPVCTSVWPHSAVHLWTLPTGSFNERIKPNWPLWSKANLLPVMKCREPYKQPQPGRLYGNLAGGDVKIYM